MEQRNRKIIQAILQKASVCCPGSLALIGIYGSFLTGDIHGKSDLDLLILINDEAGYQLASTFIQEDLQVGHDLYCTTWEMLEADAAFSHPHISKLMDSEIVYCSDESCLSRLESLRRRASQAETLEAARQTLKEAGHSYALAMLASELSDVRVYAGCVMHYAMDAIALLNHRYFRLGVKRIFEEIESMERKPEQLRTLADRIICAQSARQTKLALSEFLSAVEKLFEIPSGASRVIQGTYEEMFSNWRSKMYLAARTEDRYLAFSSMCSLNAMLKELGFSYDVLSGFDPNDLYGTAQAFDRILEQYRAEYKAVGISVASYGNIDRFIESYTK